MTGRILVVGGLNMDLVFQLPRWPHADETVLGRSYRTVPGGKGATQAVAAAHLGAQVTMVGCVGQDEFGVALLQSLRAAGVEVDDVRTSSQGTGVAMVGIEPGGQSRSIIVPGANRGVTPAHVEDVRSRFQEAEWLLLQMEIPLETNLAAVELAGATGTRIILTPAPPPQFELPEELFEEVDIIVANRREAEALTSRGNPEDAAMALHRRGVRCAIVTLAAEGAILSDEQGPRRVEPFQVETVDSTAAGDAFIGALAVALAGKRSVDEAARFASAAGALAVTRVGAQSSLPTLEEVEALLASSEGRLPPGYPDEWERTFVSRHGEEYLVRPILPSDAPRLRRLFNELSKESIYRRFFTHRRNLSEEEARRFATVDYQDQFALVAAPLAEPERLVAVARFALTEERVGGVEMAIVVGDAFQGRGIGRYLFSELARVASSLSHSWMLVETQPDNERMIDLAEGTSYPTEIEHDSQLVRIWLALQP